jgi:hypothetical protein
MNSTEVFPTATVVSNQENLKLWLSELTHLTPPQVEQLVEQMEQQKSQPLETAAR